VLGGTNIGTSAAGNTVTLAVNADTIADSYVTDAGTAIPSGGILNVLGGAGVGTVGAGNSLTINAETITSVATDVGTAVPDAAGLLRVLGGLNVNTAGAGNVVTVNVDDPGEGVVQSSATGVFSASKGNDGEVLIGSTGGAPAWSTITAGLGISIVNATNSITISSPNLAPTAICNFRAYMAADKLNVTGDGTVYTIPFDTEWLDIGNDFDTATGIFTAPLKGIYCFIGNIYCQDDILGHNTAETKILIAGTYPQANAQNNINPVPIIDNSNAYTFLASATTLMDVGDTARLTVQISGGAKNVDIIAIKTYIRSWFGGFLLAVVP
jgi:hypothetical protein